MRRKRKVRTKNHIRWHVRFLSVKVTHGQVIAVAVLVALYLLVLTVLSTFGDIKPLPRPPQPVEAPNPGARGSVLRYQRAQDLSPGAFLLAEAKPQRPPHPGSAGERAHPLSGFSSCWP